MEMRVEREEETKGEKRNEPHNQYKWAMMMKKRDNGITQRRAKSQDRSLPKRLSSSNESKDD
jgi:hypothetical protein